MTPQQHALADTIAAALEADMRIQAAWLSGVCRRYNERRRESKA